MRIRPARPEDIEAMHEIRLAVRENRLAPSAGVTEESYLPFLTGKGAGWVAEADGKLLGFAIVDAAAGNVWALFVDAAAEGRGAGRALLEAMLAWWAGQGFERLWLTTAPGTRAERFYCRSGWTRSACMGDGEVRFDYDLRGWRPATEKP